MTTIMSPPIPFGRFLRLGSRGRDCQAVGRALARAGYGTLVGVLPILGPVRVTHLRRFQKAHHLAVDGVYGPITHKELIPWFDNYSFLLYTGRQPHPPPLAIALPADFTPTHQTAGLPGYPAIDVFGPPGATALAPATGTIRKLSGHDPSQGGEPGSSYGWSIYLATAHADYFLTHFGSRDVRLNDTVRKGERLGTICDAKAARMPSNLSHIHEGKASL